VVEGYAEDDLRRTQRRRHFRGIGRRIEVERCK
jgi:hypothetical protein